MLAQCSGVAHGSHAAAAAGCAQLKLSCKTKDGRRTEVVAVDEDGVLDVRFSCIWHKAIVSKPKADMKGRPAVRQRPRGVAGRAREGAGHEDSLGEEQERM